MRHHFEDFRKPASQNYHGHDPFADYRTGGSGPRGERSHNPFKNGHMDFSEDIYGVTGDTRSRHPFKHQAHDHHKPRSPGHPTGSHETPHHKSHGAPNHHSENHHGKHHPASHHQLRHHQNLHGHGAGHHNERHRQHHSGGSDHGHHPPSHSHPRDTGAGDRQMRPHSGSPSQNGFGHNLLKSLGLPVSEKNLSFLDKWHRAEGGSADNPFNTTQHAPGARQFNSVGVKRYPSMEVGLQATVKTLTNGLYNNILHALRHEDPHAAAQALRSSQWGTKNI